MELLLDAFVWDPENGKAFVDSTDANTARQVLLNIPRPSTLPLPTSSSAAGALHRKVLKPIEHFPLSPCPASIVDTEPDEPRHALSRQLARVMHNSSQNLGQ